MKSHRAIAAVLLAAFALILSGCAQQGYSVIASTGTTIGVSLGQQPASGGLDATLGYKRAEFALVPTNRPANATSTGVVTGAGESADVIMELRYGGMLSTSPDAAIYQRLAIGSTAVMQPGAAYMFAKGPDGKIDEKVLAAVSSIPAGPRTIPTELRTLTEKYNEYRKAGDKATVEKFDKAAQAQQYKDYRDFHLNFKPADIPKVRKLLADGNVKLD